MAPTDTMRAVIVESYGDWNDARLGVAKVPEPGEEDVLIRAEASAINFPDLLMIEGKYQIKPTAPFVPGRDVAGEVVGVGSKVTVFKVGDRVAATPNYGAFAEFVVAPEATCVALPEQLDFTTAAAAATVLATVVAAMKLRARLAPGEWVMITGAAGGVGSFGIGYARYLGAHVVAVVSSDEKEEAARRLGAEIVLRADRFADPRIDMRRALSEAGREGVDAVVDMVGGKVYEGAIRCVSPGGRYVVVGFASGEIPAIPANYILLKDLIVLGSSLSRLFRIRDPELRAGLEAAFKALGDGALSVEIESVLALSDFVQAARRVAERQVVGKIVFDHSLSRSG
jgi:NADPH:quinone reductase